MIIPGFVQQRADGLYLDVGEVSNPRDIVQFFDRVFSNGTYLAGLDYAVMQNVLYPQRADGQRSQPFVQRIATAVKPFPPERQALYKSIKISDDGTRVEYVFEPVHIERTVDVPIFGPDSNGNMVQTGSFQEIITEPTQLDLDEFIAAMWQKGLRCGMDVALINSIITAPGKPGTQRVDIAQRIPAKAGNDATLSEQTTDLRRDDAPKILPNGKIDLRQFSNRFPQVSANTPLLKKEPRRLGEPGYEISGVRIEPDIPRDFTLDELSGAGTRVDRTAAGEFIVATRDGFLHIDADTGQISVLDKIINKTGVSARTTGDLALSGDVFEEHGEVQEKRVVEGRHMTFMADVFGSIVSHGGNIHCAANLVGSKVSNPGGTVRVDQRCSNAVIEARGGSITLATAEGCTLIAATVNIEHATGCYIVADNISIANAASNAVMGRRLEIGSATTRRDSGSVFTVVEPDFSSLDARINEIKKMCDELSSSIIKFTQQRDSLLADPSFRSYLAADAGARSGKIKLTPAQDAQLQQLGLKYARTTQTTRDLARQIDQANARLSTANEELANLNSERHQSGEKLFITIRQITGDTLIRKTRCRYGSELCATMTAPEIRSKLRETSSSFAKLDDLSVGSFTWVYAEAP